MGSGQAPFDPPFRRPVYSVLLWSIFIAGAREQRTVGEWKRFRSAPGMKMQQAGVAQW